MSTTLAALTRGMTGPINNMKKSFILYTDNKKTIDAMSNEQAGQFIKAIYAYHAGEAVSLDPTLSLVFTTFETAFIRDAEKYEEMSKIRSEVGKRGGLASAKKRWGDSEASKSKQNKQLVKTVSKVTVSDNVSDNDSLAADLSAFLGSAYKYEDGKHQRLTKAGWNTINKPLAYLRVLQDKGVNGKPPISPSEYRRQPLKILTAKEQGLV
jgi:hypothetical protein